MTLTHSLVCPGHKVLCLCKENSDGVCGLQGHYTRQLTLRCNTLWHLPSCKFEKINFNYFQTSKISFNSVIHEYYTVETKNSNSFRIWTSQETRLPSFSRYILIACHLKLTETLLPNQCISKWRFHMFMYKWKRYEIFHSPDTSW